MDLGASGHEEHQSRIGVDLARDRHLRRTGDAIDRPPVRLRLFELHLMARADIEGLPVEEHQCLGLADGHGLVLHGRAISAKEHAIKVLLGKRAALDAGHVLHTLGDAHVQRQWGIAEAGDLEVRLDGVFARLRAVEAIGLVQLEVAALPKRDRVESLALHLGPGCAVVDLVLGIEGHRQPGIYLQRLGFHVRQDESFFRGEAHRTGWRGNSRPVFHAEPTGRRFQSKVATTEMNVSRQPEMAVTVQSQTAGFRACGMDASVNQPDEAAHVVNPDLASCIKPRRDLASSNLRDGRMVREMRHQLPRPLQFEA